MYDLLAINILFAVVVMLFLIMSYSLRPVCKCKFLDTVLLFSFLNTVFRTVFLNTA